MTFALDCRMCGKSGIGAFIDGILPHLLSTEHDFLLLGLDANHRLPSLPPSLYEAKNASLLPCDIAAFSLKETFFFPRAIAKKINACDAFVSPYCNIPSGIHIPIYSTIHDIVFLDMALAGKIGTLARKAFYRHAIRKSQAIFTVSEFSRERIIKKLHCKKPIHVVHSSVPEYLQEPLNPLPAKTDTIIFVGNIKRHKGLHTLIPAFESFRASCKTQSLPLPRLLVLGEKNNFRTQDSELSSLEKVEGVEFTGFVTNEKLKVLLSEAKILVQPSLYEGFGLPPMEALCCGTKAVVSDIPVFKEVYAGLPVTFFRTEDKADLAQKLLAVWKENASLAPTKNRYSFAKTASTILEVLSTQFSCKRA